MRVVLRKLDAAEYWGPDGRWSTDAEKAVDFEYVPRALDYALHAGMKNVRISLYDTARHTDMLMLPSPPGSHQPAV